MEIIREDVQDYLSKYSNSSIYRNDLSMLKVFLRDYEKHPELVEGFRFPRVQFSPKSTPCQIGSPEVLCCHEGSKGQGNATPLCHF
ncbi:MAG: hypothetical protein WHS82_05520 [Candidatus Methanosuratincola sp.]